jgi:DNA-binding CsgD family transcriptional regulator
LGLNERLLGVIDELYAGALDHARSSASLYSVASMTGASGGIMYLVDEIEHRLIHSFQTNFYFDAATQVDGEHARMIATYHRRIPLGAAVHVHSLWPMDHMVKTSFYNEVLRKQDVMFGAACLFHRTPRIHGLMTLNRSARAGPFDEANFRALQLLAPHVRRAMQLATELGDAARQRNTFVLALDQLSLGVIVTDARGKPIHLNRAAEQIVAKKEGFTIRRGHISAEVPEEHRRLEQLLGAAAGASRATSFLRSGSCKVTRPSGKLPLVLLIAPCGDLPAADFVSMRPVCLILIRDPAQQPRNGAVELRQLFGLTMQESKIAIAVGEGRGIARVAEEMGLSTHTVRNHLQRVFGKTNTTRQGDLVRLVTGLLTAAPSNPG